MTVGTDPRAEVRADHTSKESQMFSMTRVMALVVTVFALVTLTAARADDPKPIDGVVLSVTF